MFAASHTCAYASSLTIYRFAQEFDGVDDLSGPPNTNGVPFSIDSVPRLVCDSIVRVDAEVSLSHSRRLGNIPVFLVHS
jgi:hypothetical protein